MTQLLVILVVSVGDGGSLEIGRASEEAEPLIRELRSAKATYTLDKHGGVATVELTLHAVNKPLIAMLAATRSLVKLDVWGDNVSDVHFTGVDGFRNLKRLSLSHTKIGDATMKSFSKSACLEGLNLESTRVGAVGLRRIQSSTLTKLAISGPGVDDETLNVIRRFSRLEKLIVGGTKTSDVGALRLLSLKSLTTLYIHAPQMTSNGRLALREAAPTGCRIVFAHDLK